MGKLKIELNDTQNIRDLLQEAYKLADEQLIQAQNEINKMSNATKLQEEAMDSKAKYGKIINDYLTIKDKAISKKLDIAKLLRIYIILRATLKMRLKMVKLLKICLSISMT